ncbi:MAG: serine/threonine-protein kinase [Acidobacteriota bacterium]
MSHSTRWSSLEAHLERLLELDPDAREEFLAGLTLDDEIRRELQDLLRAAEDEPSLLRRPADAVLESLTEEQNTPREIGPYRLLDSLGTGGMGAVFLAERTDGVYSARVAIKLLRGHSWNPEAKRRFHAEREILASLRHPSIARLLDGGTTDDGQPFLVMEWVDGLPIDRWCRTTEASLEERLRLVIQVCRAVQSAHQNLVVHRDLKPANILVDTDGRARLLDFGIAKLLDAEALPHLQATQTGLAPLTPAYASPEQVQGGPISTATDVYALGVVLYELLTGRRPHEQDPERQAVDLLVAIRDLDPPRPSTRIGRLRASNDQAKSLALPPERLQRRLRGDLDHIVMQTLAKEPTRRYPTADQLARDLERFLDGRPVEARKAGAWYWLGKFIARHRLAVGAATIAAFLVLGSLAALLLQRQETLAQQARAELTTTFLVDQLHDASPLADRAPRTVRELLDRSVDRLSAIDAPAVVRADLETAMGRAYLGVGEAKQAHDLLIASLAARRQLGVRADVLETLLLLAEVELDRGAVASGARRAQEALALATLSERPKALVTAGYAELLRGRLGPSEELLRTAVASPTLPPAERAQALWILGMTQSSAGRYDAAEHSLNEAFERAQRAVGPDHPSVARILTSLGVLERLRLKPDAARKRIAEADAVYGRSLERDHPDRLALDIHRAEIALLEKDHEVAESLLRAAAAAFRRQPTDAPHPRLAEALDELGSLLSRTGRLQESREHLEEALALRESLYGGDHASIAESLEHLALLDVREGRSASAIDLLERAGEIVARTLGPDHVRRGVYARHRGNVLYRMKRTEEALDQLLEARDLLAAHDDQGVEVARLSNSLGVVQRRLGRHAQSRRDHERAIALIVEELGGEHERIGLYTMNLARLEVDAGQPDRACTLADEALAIYDLHALGPDHAYRARLDTIRARCLAALDRVDEAQTLLEARLARLDSGAAGDVDPTIEALAALVDIIRQRGLDPGPEEQRLERLRADRTGPAS